MASYRHRGGYGPPPRRSYQSHSRDDFYDDRRSRSRSPPDQRHNPPYQRRSPEPENYRSRNNNHRDETYGRRSPGRWEGRSRDRDFRHERNSPSPRSHRGYHDRDRPPDDHDRRPRSRDASYSPEPRRPTSRGKPSKEILMEDLAPHITESDITNELKEHYRVTALDDVRIIRDRETKQSRQFGFLRFPTLEDAESFMDRNYPILYLYGSNDNTDSDPESAKVRISYGRERRDNRTEEGDWICSSCHINNFATRTRCFRCQAPRTDFVPVVAQKAANVGDNDASPDNAPSQFLLVRGLELSVTEELFAKGVAKLNKPAGSTQSSSSSLKKTAKVASTTGDANLGAKEGTLRRVLLVRDRRSNESWRYGFAEYATIEDAQAALTRYNSFERFTIASKQVIVSYIHAGVFVPVLNPTASTERFLFSPFNNPSLKLQYWDEEAYVTELVVSAPEADVQESKNNSTTVFAQDEGLKSTKDADKIKKRKAQGDQGAAPTKKAAPSTLQFWSNRHAELHGIKQNGSAPNSDAGDEAVPSQSFADPVRFCCYLCMRQFNNAVEVNKHERLSDLHRQNLKDESKIKKAMGKLEKHSVQPQQTQAAPIEYRDRAKERRKIYGVVNKKGEQVGSKPKLDESDHEPEAPAPSKGASLLSKMGYTAGQGLGASGEGMKAPISQDMYVAGVGLGAQGGKVGDAVETAEKNTKGDYSTWAEGVRQGARERYSRME